MTIYRDKLCWNWLWTDRHIIRSVSSLRFLPCSITWQDCSLQLSRIWYLLVHSLMVFDRIALSVSTTIRWHDIYLLFIALFRTSSVQLTHSVYSMHLTYWVSLKVFTIYCSYLRHCKPHQSPIQWWTAASWFWSLRKHCKIKSGTNHVLLSYRIHLTKNLPNLVLSCELLLLRQNVYARNWSSGLVHCTYILSV